MTEPTTLYDRLISGPRPRWVNPLAGILLLLAPVAAAAADGALDRFVRESQWQTVLIAPAIIFYILMVAPALKGSGGQVLDSFRSLAPDTAQFDALVSSAARIRPASEVLACGAGLLVGLPIVLASAGEGPLSWVGATWIIQTLAMYALLMWTVYAAIASSRLTPAIQRLPLRIDPLDTAPFEPIGRRSLLLALTFLGGLTLSFAFTAFRPETLQRVEYWLMTMPLVLIAVLVFYLNMYPTHRLLAAARKQELARVQAHLKRACRALLQQMEEQQVHGNLAAEINALTAYEQRLLAASTWPYNIAMLRTLFVSILIPGGAALARFAADLLFG